MYKWATPPATAKTMPIKLAEKLYSNHLKTQQDSNAVSKASRGMGKQARCAGSRILGHVPERIAALMNI